MLTTMQLVNMFEADKNANMKALGDYRQALQYYHGHQLTQAMINLIESRGQIPIVENIYKMIINKILGYKIQATQEIKVVGRIEETKNLATLLQDILRSINQSKTYDREIHLRDRDLLFGLGVLELWVVKDSEGNNKITLKHIPTESFLIDKYSTDLNALDSTRFHKILNINEMQSLNLDIKPNFDLQDNIEKRAMIIESWIKENGKWNRYIWHTQGQIYKYEESPFKNGAHPFVVSKYQQDENFVWYGLFRDLKPLQDSINYAENRMANMMGSIKAFFEESAVEDAEEFIAMASADNAIVKVRDQALQLNKLHFVQHHADISALTQKAQEKRNLAKILSGLNEEALGMATNRQSGVAITQRREAGLMGLQIYVMQSDLSDKILYEKIIDLIQHYYTKPQMFRITDKNNIDRYFNINTDSSNTIKVGEFDLIYTTQLRQAGREERFAHWTEIMKTLSQMRPDIVTSLLPIMLKDTESPIVADVQEVLAQSDEAQKQGQEAQAQEAQMQKELEIAQLKAKIREMEAEALKKETQATFLQNQIQALQNMQNNPQATQVNNDLAQANTQEEVQKKLNKQMQLSMTDMR